MANLISVHIRIPPQLWIAVEGKIDSDAASRFRKFLLQTDRDWPATLPFYFPSPGGIERFEIDAMAVERPRAIDHVGEDGDAHAGRHHAANGPTNSVRKATLRRKTGSNSIFSRRNDDTSLEKFEERMNEGDHAKIASGDFTGSRNDSSIRALDHSAEL